MKTCSECKKSKKLRDFHKCSSSKDGYHGRCRKCISADHARYRASEKGRNNQLRNKYGITAKDYDRMFSEQDGKCAICGDPQDNKALAVDHCHETSRVRGLLCDSCNRGIGMFLNDPTILTAAAAYLITNETATAVV